MNTRGTARTPRPQPRPAPPGPGGCIALGLGLLTCFPPPPPPPPLPPPPLLCWAAAAEVVAKAAGGGGAERAVQLLHRISPCPPFFHMEEDVLRHTLQVGFSPSGILRPARGPRARQRAAGARRPQRPRRRPLPGGGGCGCGGAGSGGAGPALCWRRPGPGPGTNGARAAHGLVSPRTEPWHRERGPVGPIEGGRPDGALGTGQPGEGLWRPRSTFQCLKGTYREAIEGLCQEQQ